MRALQTACTRTLAQAEQPVAAAAHRNLQQQPEDERNRCAEAAHPCLIDAAVDRRRLARAAERAAKVV